MIGMLKNYLKIAFRNILRHKGHSFINITGLGIGMAACLLIFLWVQDELSFDRFHSKSGRIYRVASQYEQQDKLTQIASTPMPLASALIREFPWIYKSIKFGREKMVVKSGDKVFDEDIFFTDPEVFQIFDFPLVTGNPETALREPRSILISEDMKEKYFGRENPVGKTLNLSDWRDFKITGIFKNIPQNSHFKFGFLASILNYRLSHKEQWGVSNYKTYILVKKDAPIEVFDEKMQPFIEKYRGKELWSKYKYSYFLQPLDRLHLHSNLENEIEPNRDIKTVYIFTSIAFFILFIACLNYINLATARFTNRTREVGLRKVLGASPSQLIKQFLCESFLFAVITLPLALSLSKIALPLFNYLSGKTLTINLLHNLYLSLGVVGVILFVGLGAGFLPALFISAFKPESALQGIFKPGSFIFVLRRSLVIFQFSVSIIFIIIMMIVNNQTQYIKNRDLGLNKENVVNIHINHNKEAQSNYENIKNEFRKHHNVISVCASGFSPGPPYWNMNYWHGGVRSDEYRHIQCTPVDYDFFETLEMKFIEGRPFSRHFATDKDACILNEAAVKDFGWKLAMGKDFDLSHWKKGKIIGVVKNFNFDSLHNEIEPLVLFFDPQSYAYFQARIAAGDIPETINFLKEKWAELVPGQTFEYSFLDEDFNNLYKDEVRLGEIFLVVAIAAIFIACLGMWGLAVYATEQRTKEIGIRKVLGCSVSDIVLLLTKNFARWVFAANLIAWPIAWYAMNKWLQNFAYRVEISIQTFIITGLFALIAALCTISYKVVRSARMNPIESLRYE